MRSNDGDGDLDGRREEVIGELRLALTAGYRGALTRIPLICYNIRQTKGENT
jgi:hypothetical protein